MGEKHGGLRGGILLILSINEPTILISRTTGTRSNTIMILQRGIQTWIDVVVASFHVRRRLAQVFFNKQTNERTKESSKIERKLL